MFTPPATPWPSSGFINYDGHSNDGVVIGQKTIANPGGGKAVRLNLVDDFLIEDIHGIEANEKGAQILQCNGGLLRNIHFDANFKQSGSSNGIGFMFGQRNSDGSHLVAANMAVLDSLVEKIRQGSGQAYPQGDGGLVENGSTVMVENHESRDCVDSHWDVKGSLWLRNAVLIGGPLQRKSIRAHSGAVIYLMNVHIDGEVGTGLEISGGNPDWPNAQVGKDAVIYCWNCTFGPNIYQEVLFKSSSQGGPIASQDSLVILTQDPFPDGLPLYQPGGAPPPPPPPGEEPMSSLQPDYAFHHKQGAVTTFIDPTDIAYGVKEGDAGFNDNFFYTYDYVGTLGDPTVGPLTDINRNSWDNQLGGNPAASKGDIKSVFVRPKVATPPPPPPPTTNLTAGQVDDVNALIENRLAAIPRKTVLGG